jgi:hypothetical protein
LALSSLVLVLIIIYNGSRGNADNDQLIECEEEVGVGVGVGWCWWEVPAKSSHTKSSIDTFDESPAYHTAYNTGWTMHVRGVRFQSSTIALIA